MDVPCVLTIHDLVWKKFPETMKPANLFVEKLLMPASVRLASAIIAVSKSTAEDIQHCFQSSPEAIKLVYEAAELDQRLNLQREISDPYFLFVGTNEPRKNLARLLEGYDQYRKSGGSLRLVIAGSVGWGEETRPAESVKILGYVDDHRLDGLIRFSTALLLPSLYEGFGLPILEALQRGVPVITSNVSSMPELAGEAGILVNPLVSAELSDAMARMSDSNLRDAYAKQSLSQASKFSWENAAKETLSIILETAA
jgi:glycosyltransferase involved in cell wall biosynthesis